MTAEEKAREILGPTATEGAVQASAELIRTLAKAFKAAGEGGRVAIETIGPRSGQIYAIVAPLEGGDDETEED